MIDYVKFQPLNFDPLKLLQHPELEFILDYNDRTSELNTKKKKAIYRGLTFTIINERYVEISGSIHKYKNNGRHNFDKFYFSEIKQVLYELSVKFEIDLSQCRILNIEIGVNIKIDHFLTSDILKNLIFHRNKHFQDPPIKNGNYRQVVHQRYFIKCYDKALQYSLGYQLMRFEIKAVKMIDFNKKGIVYLKDLLNKSNLQIAINLLLVEWDKTFLYDYTIQSENLSKHISNIKLNQWNNRNFWLDIEKQQKNYELKKYFEVVQKFSKNIHEILRNEIKNEGLRLLV
jgi:hypothetical protein